MGYLGKRMGNKLPGNTRSSMFFYFLYILRIFSLKSRGFMKKSGWIREEGQIRVLVI